MTPKEKTLPLSIYSQLLFMNEMASPCYTEYGFYDGTWSSRLPCNYWGRTILISCSMTPLSTNFLPVLLPVPQFHLPSYKALRCLVKPTYHLKLGGKFSVLPMTESVSSWVHEAELVASFCFISREISVWKGSISFPQCSPLPPFEENLGKHNTQVTAPGSFHSWKQSLRKYGS